MTVLQAAWKSGGQHLSSGFVWLHPTEFTSQDSPALQNCQQQLIVGAEVGPNVGFNVGVGGGDVHKHVLIKAHVGPYFGKVHLVDSVVKRETFAFALLWMYWNPTNTYMIFWHGHMNNRTTLTFKNRLYINLILFFSHLYIYILPHDIIGCRVCLVLEQLQIVSLHIFSSIFVRFE